VSKVWTLESMQEELEREYAPFRFRAGGEDFVLRSLLRIDKTDRDKIMEELRLLSDENEDVDEDAMLGTVHFVLSTVTADGKGDRLVRAIGNDLLLNMKVLQHWTEATQPGEVTDSPS
jgi:hypothetical protein